MVSIRHAQDVARAVQRQDYPRLEQLHISPPTRNKDTLQQDAVEMGRSAVEALASNNVVSLKPRTQVLRPLDLTFAPNTILTIGAHSGTGKSALAEQILLDLTSQGAMALDISIELDTEAKRYRYFQHMGGSGVGMKAYQEGRINSGQLLPVIADFMHIEKPSGGNPGIPRRLQVDGSLNTLPEIIAGINAFAEEHRIYAEECKTRGLPHPGPAIVVVDFLQSVSVPYSASDQHQKITQIVEDLYTLTKARKLAMIWTSQLRKKDRFKMARATTIEEELPDLDEYEGTNRIGNLSHTALFLHKPKEGFQRHGHTKVYAHLPKVRSGEPKTFEGLFTGDTMDFDFDPISIAKKI